MANYDHNHRFLTVFMELIIIEELHAMNMLEVKFWLISSEFSEFFNNIPYRILLDVLFCVFRFSKASFNAMSYLHFAAILALISRRKVAMAIL